MSATTTSAWYADVLVSADFLQEPEASVREALRFHAPRDCDPATVTVTGWVRLPGRFTASPDDMWLRAIGRAVRRAEQPVED